MPIRLKHERDNIFRMRIAGTLTHAEFDECRQRLVPELARLGSIRLLVQLERFAGWEKSAAWGGDLSFYATHGDAISRIAIVGDEKWRDEALMFAVADLRQGPVEYFPEGASARALEWLAG